MSERFVAGATSQTVDVFLQDSSSSTGAGLTGLAYNTSSLTCYYRKGATGTSTAITLATQTVGGAWSSGGFVEIDATNQPGMYRFDVPNAVIDTAGMATVYFRGATNLAQTPLRIDCKSVPSRIAAGDLATDSITADVLKADAVTEIQSGLATSTALATAQTSIDDLPTNAELATALASADDAVLAAIAALNNLSASGAFSAVLTTQLTESYAADGTAPTLAQAIFLIQQSLHEFAISGTTRTVKKLDGSTTAATFTLNDATNPTSTTRAS